MPGPGHSEWARDTDEEDRVELAIRKSGCWDQHIACVECMTDKGDWRMCQDPLNAFKECMRNYTQKKREEEELLRTIGATSNHNSKK